MPAFDAPASSSWAVETTPPCRPAASVMARRFQRVERSRQAIRARRQDTNIPHPRPRGAHGALQPQEPPGRPRTDPARMWTALVTLVPVGLALGLLAFGRYGERRPPVPTARSVATVAAAALLMGP